MKSLFTFLALAVSLQLSASHLLGGGITWECVGNNQIILKVELYRECGMGSAGLSNTLNVDATSLGSISVSKDTVLEISPDCLGGGTIQCGVSPSGTGAIEVHRYLSSPVTMPSSIPSSGIKFSWSMCCRPSTVVNINGQGNYLESVLYDHGVGNCDSPEFFDYNFYLNTGNSISHLASRPNPGDSLYYDFYHLRGTSTGSLVTYNAGFSGTQPLPNSQTDPQNGAVSIDHQTGLISYDINSGVTGGYATGVKVECWRNGQLTSVITRDFTSHYNGSAPSNNAPSALIDTAIYDLTYNNGRYQAHVTLGDSVHFRAGASDFDLNNGNPQLVTFDAAGSALDSNWGGIYNFQDEPVLSPVAPQSSFVSAQNNQVAFDWLITSEHLAGAKTRYFFNLQFHDDACPTNGRVNLPVEVIVSAPASIPMDSITVCENDSLQLPGNAFSGNYQWSPATEISSTTAANPWVYPTASRYYYLEDPNNPGFKDSIFVDLEMRKTFELDSVNSMLEVTDSVQSGNRVWYYNGVPFSYPHDTLTPFGPGDYSVVLNTENCRYESDTISFLPGSYSMADPGNGNLAPNTLSVNAAWGVQFELTNSAAGNLNTIYLPGIDTSGETTADDLQFQLYDSNGNLMWSKDTVVTSFSQGVFQVSLMQNLQANEQYTLAVTGDSGYAFHYFEDLPNLPVSPWNNGLSVTGLFEGAANTLPAQPHNKLLPLVLEVESTIGLDSYSESKVRVYPNPAQDRIYIEGAKMGSRLQLLDLQGKVIRQKVVNAEKQVFEIGDLPTGVYLLRSEGFNTFRTKIVLE